MILEQLQLWDARLFEAINAWHAPWADELMYYISEKWPWIPLYLLVVGYAFYRHPWRRALLFMGGLILTIVLTDQLSASVLKPWVARFRPCRPEAGLDFAVHMVRGHCGGKFGFVSSHAANFFGMATFISLFFRTKAWVLPSFLLAALAAYSRVYLGVHYPGDVLGGALLGMLMGSFTAWLVQLTSARLGLETRH